jgi:hypothetical protein
MAKQKEKSKYQGPKLSGDNAEYRKKAQARAEKNAQGVTTNAVFATQDPEFQKYCQEAGVQPTTRQASKFRNNYGKAAYAANKNTRKVVGL